MTDKPMDTEGNQKRFRAVTVAHMMKDMTTEAIRLRIQDLKALVTHKIKREPTAPEYWDLADAPQLKEEYDNRIHRNRV